MAAGRGHNERMQEKASGSLEDPLPSLAAAAATEASSLMERMGTSLEGLTEAEAGARLGRFGFNEVGEGERRPWVRRVGRAAGNPLVLLLAGLAAVSFATGDPEAGAVMLLMVALGLGLRLVQETKAANAAGRLRAMIHVTATVVRGGQRREVPVRELVPGDVVALMPGDMVPGDARLVSAKDLCVTQASLTGESLPVEKGDAPDPRGDVDLVQRTNLCFMGTSVETGVATAVILATGSGTHLGGVAQSLVGDEPETAFDRGVRRFTWLMLRLMAVLVPLVLVVNGATKHDWKEAFFFALAVAVGLTPEMLPMIVSVCLSKGALAMSGKKVIVKRLHSIQDLGAMDVLCTDKTGTLTQDRVILELHVDVFRRKSMEVLRDAYLVSHFQSGLRNVLDRAILAHQDVHEALPAIAFRKVDEIPFDFARRMASVVVERPDGTRELLSKGAPESILARCAAFESEGQVFPMDPIFKGDIQQQVNDLCGEGFRVLAVASRAVDARPAYSRVDEAELVLTGYLAFLDPPKDSARHAIDALRRHGVRIKVLTGDNDLVTLKVCREVGLPATRAVLGHDIEGMSDAELSVQVEAADVFARLLPSHKRRVVRALQARGHVVGFMGDGINDAPALRAADVGISVDNATDVARDSADMVLLEKSLLVLDEGVTEGRKVFVNILKYVRMGASSSFGNMLSVLGASAFLPFVPMAPIQVLANNLLYDFSQVPIPTDHVTPGQVTQPRPWDLGNIQRFILLLGPISSMFDYATFAVLWAGFGCNDASLAPPPSLASRFAGVASPNDTYAAALFHTGWFVESLVTQTLIVHVIRTDGLPFVHSRASWQLTWTTLGVMVLGAWLPASPAGPFLGLVPLPPAFWPFLLVTVVAYLGLTQAAKAWLLRRSWI